MSVDLSEWVAYMGEKSTVLLNNPENNYVLFETLPNAENGKQTPWNPVEVMNNFERYSEHESNAAKFMKFAF